LGGVGTFGVVACVQEVAVTPGELLADADLIHYTLGASEPVSVLTFDTFEQRAEGGAERLKAGGPYREAEIGRSESWNLVSRIRSGDGGVARPLRQDRVGA
jgi:hypothetical protein